MRISNIALKLIATAGILTLTASAAWAAKGKPSGNTCQNIPATWQFDNTQAGLYATVDGSVFGSEIFICSGTTDTTLNLQAGSSTPSVNIDLIDVINGQPAPGWMDGAHPVFINLRRLLHNPDNPGTSYANLAEVPNTEYSFTTVMVIRPDDYDAHPLYLFNPAADTFNYTNGVSDLELINPPLEAPPSGYHTALVRVTHSMNAAGQHQWVAEPEAASATDPAAVATQLYTERIKGKTSTYRAGQFTLSFKVTITAVP